MYKIIRFIVLLLCIFLCFLGCYITKANDLDVDYSREAILVRINEISVDYEIKNDLSVSWEWKLSQRLDFLDAKHMFIQFEMITMDNAHIGMFLSNFNHFSTGIRPEDIIKPLVIAYPKNPKYLHAIITKYNDTWTEKEQWFFNIDISNINVVISGEEMKSGIFTRFVGQWVPEIITLEDGQLFMANAYYLIISYLDTYRELELKNSYALLTGKELELNRNSYAIFKVANDTDIIRNEDRQLNLNSGGLYLEEMHLRKILINGNSYDGFTLLVTPESKNIFKVEEGSAPKY